MSLQRIVYGALVSLPALTAVVPATRILEASNLSNEEGQAPVRPFLIYKTGSELPSWPSIEDNLMEFWVYDDHGSYDRINQILRALKDGMDRRAGDILVLSGVKWALMESRFQFASADLQDESLHAIVRYASYRVVGSRSG